MYALRSDTDHRRFTCRRRHFRASRRNARETVSIVGYGTSSGILNQGDDVLVRRDYSPVLRQAELHTVTIPCWASPASARPSCRPWVSRATTPCARSRFLGWHRLVVDRPAAYVDDEFQGATHGFGVGGDAAHLGAGQIPAGEGPSYSRAESPSRCPRKDAPKPGNDLLTQNLHPRHRTALCLQRHIRNRGPRRCSPDFGFLLT